MKRVLKLILIMASFWLLLSGCRSGGKLYREKNKIYIGQLADTVYRSVRKVITVSTHSVLRDTLNIRYDYNDETCWDLLDLESDEYIYKVIGGRKKLAKLFLDTRNNHSAFSFREPGYKINKIKKWDETIIIDSSRQLFNLLFKQRCTCGSSIIILPDCIIRR